MTQDPFKLPSPKL